MGKSCVRFRKLDDVALDVLGEAVARVPPEQIIAAHDERTVSASRRLRSPPGEAAPSMRAGSRSGTE